MNTSIFEKLTLKQLTTIAKEITETPNELSEKTENLLLSICMIKTKSFLQKFLPDLYPVLLKAIVKRLENEK